VLEENFTHVDAPTTSVTVETSHGGKGGESKTILKLTVKLAKSHVSLSLERKENKPATLASWLTPWKWNWSWIWRGSGGAIHVTNFTGKRVFYFAHIKVFVLFYSSALKPKEVHATPIHVIRSLA